MIFPLAPVFYAAVSVATLWLAVLWVGSRWGVSGSSRLVKTVFGLATILILLLPVDGLPLWSWAYSFCPNPSLTMLGLVGAGLWQRLFGVAVFKPADWHATWIFGAGVGTVLYLHPMCFGAVDLYYWGWDREGAWAIGALAIAFLACGNRLGVLLLAALIAFALDALESANCWDYIIDPFFWLISVTVVATRMINGWVARRRRVRVAAEVRVAEAG